MIGSFGVRHRQMEVLEFVVKIADSPTAGDGLIEDRAALHLFHILTKVADGHLLGNRDLTFIGGLLTNHQAEEGRFAVAVSAIQTDLLARVQLKGSINKEQLFHILLMNIRKREHPKTKLPEFIRV